MKLLIKANYDIDIETASDGQIAVEMYKKGLRKRCGCDFKTFRLIIMDLDLPRMNGKEASSLIFKMASAAKKTNKAEMTHIVVMTSFLTKQLSEELISLGIKKIYSKPLQLKQINEIMELNYLADRTII